MGEGLYCEVQSIMGGDHMELTFLWSNRLTHIHYWKHPATALAVSYNNYANIYHNNKYSRVKNTSAILLLFRILTFNAQNAGGIVLIWFVWSMEFRVL